MRKKFPSKQGMHDWTYTCERTNMVDKCKIFVMSKFLKYQEIWNSRNQNFVFLEFWNSWIDGLSNKCDTSRNLHNFSVINYGLFQ